VILDLMIWACGIFTGIWIAELWPRLAARIRLERQLSRTDVDAWAAKLAEDLSKFND
jgi:hypothetical protein